MRSDGYCGHCVRTEYCSCDSVFIIPGRIFRSDFSSFSSNDSRAFEEGGEEEEEEDEAPSKVTFFRLPRFAGGFWDSSFTCLKGQWGLSCGSPPFILQANENLSFLAIDRKIFVSMFLFACRFLFSCASVEGALESLTGSLSPLALIARFVSGCGVCFDVSLSGSEKLCVSNWDFPSRSDLLTAGSTGPENIVSSLSMKFGIVMGV